MHQKATQTPKTKAEKYKDSLFNFIHRNMIKTNKFISWDGFLILTVVTKTDVSKLVKGYHTYTLEGGYYCPTDRDY